MYSHVSLQLCIDLHYTYSCFIVAMVQRTRVLSVTYLCVHLRGDLFVQKCWSWSTYPRNLLLNNTATLTDTGPRLSAPHHHPLKYSYSLETLLSLQVTYITSSCRCGVVIFVFVLRLLFRYLCSPTTVIISWSTYFRFSLLPMHIVSQRSCTVEASITQASFVYCVILLRTLMNLHFD